MREGNIFSLSTLARKGGGGERYPILLTGGGGGTLSQVWTGGYPIPGMDGGVSYPRSRWGGGTPSQVWTRGGRGVPYPADGKVSPSKIRTGGTPQSKTGWVLPNPRLDGVPPSRTGWGTPPPSKTGWGTPPPVSKASTCYASGGVPLAFTQEDFLVLCSIYQLVGIEIITNASTDNHFLPKTE